VTTKVDSETVGAVTPDIESVTATPTSSWLGRFGVVSQLPMSTALPLISALGGALYVALRTGYAVFYNSFGITPEEVGFGEAEIFIQSAVVLLAAVLMLLAGAFCYLLVDRLFSWVLRVNRRTRIVSDKMLRQLYWLTYYAAKVDTIVPVTTTLSDVDVVEFTRLIEMMRTWPTIIRRVVAAGAWLQVGFLGTRLDVAMLVTLGCFPIIIAFGLFVSVAAGTAAAIQEGHAGYLYTGGLRLLPWGAQHVTIVALPNSNWNVPNNDCLLYLGQANGTSIVYDVRRKETLRLPSSDVVVSAQLTRASC
jgi:hypothetical protein